MISEMNLNKYSNEGFFDRKALFEYMKQGNPSLSEANFKVKLQELLNNGDVARIGRNAYQFCNGSKSMYRYEYSDYAKKVAASIINKYPKLDFRIFELIQLNELINHQIAHNILFISVESDLGEFAFETLKELYPGKVMLNPTNEDIHRYWTEGMMIIEKLTTEAPKERGQFWNTRLEKLLVDIVKDNCIRSNFSESEIPKIYENAFGQYIVDESMMRRYAIRRTASKEILNIIRDKTEINLSIWGKNR